MFQATRPRLYALVVFLGLLLAFTAPVAAQQLSQAQTVELEQDADRPADLMVEYRNLFLGQNTALMEPERRAQNSEITREMEALRAPRRWPNRAIWPRGKNTCATRHPRRQGLPAWTRPSKPPPICFGIC